MIASRRAAVIALCLTGWVTVLDVRSIFAHPHPQSHWLIPFAFDAPHWIVIAVNVGFNIYLLWLGITFFRFTQGKERVLVAGWFTGFVLSPVQHLAPSFASPIQYINALAMAGALISAVFILFRVREQGNSAT